MRLIERGKKLNQQVEVWLCDSEKEEKLLPDNIPIGSLILIPSDKGLIVKMKNCKQEWKEL